MRASRKPTILSVAGVLKEFDSMSEVLTDAAGEEERADADPLHFIVGQDRHGHWIVTETHGLYGGIFCSKDDALRFAKFEAADRTGELELTNERLELAPRRKVRR